MNVIEYAEELDEAAEKLSYYKVSDGSCKTNESGVAQIKNLKTGVYLLYVSDQKNYEEITPVLIAVPTWGEEEGTMLYDVRYIQNILHFQPRIPIVIPIATPRTVTYFQSSCESPVFTVSIVGVSFSFGSGVCFGYTLTS